MNETQKSDIIPPVRLGYNSRFTFKCHPGVSCFTLCCRGINIILTPFDIIQMKNRLGLSSHEFLAIYTEPHLLAVALSGRFESYYADRPLPGQEETSAERDALARERARGR